MSRTLCNLYFAIALFFIGLSPSNSAATMNEQDYFRVYLPDGFEMSKASPVEDFDIYTISSKGTTYVTIYVGNQPNFPKVLKRGQSGVLEFNVPGVTIFSQWDGDLLVRQEINIVLKNNNGWPTNIHAWTGELSKDQIGMANRIIVSLQTKTNIKPGQIYNN